jgi:hypothetical protein
LARPTSVRGGVQDPRWHAVELPSEGKLRLAGVDGAQEEQERDCDLIVMASTAATLGHWHMSG